MKTLLGILLMAAAACAQDGGISGSGAPKIEKPAAPSGGRGGTQASGAPTAPSTAGRGRGATVAPAAAGGVPSPKDLKYPPLRAIQPPNATAFTLPNGMKLYLLE